MKKIVFAAMLLFSISAFANIRVDEKIERQFRESFPAATAVKWYDNKDYFEVFFVHNSVQCRISYNTDGAMIQMRRDYNKETLPLFISGAVQKKYPGKKVYGVTEITSQEGLQYHMVLEDDKNWYFVNSDSAGDISLNKKLRKA
jgi:hypothetical protein